MVKTSVTGSVPEPSSPSGGQQTVPSELQQILAKALLHPSSSPSTTPTITGITDLSTSQTTQTYNASYKITLSTNTSCVLKISPSPETRVLRYERSILESEADILRLLALLGERKGGELANVTIPEVLSYDDTGNIIDSPYILLSYIPGTRFASERGRMSSEQVERVERGMGRYLRSLADATSRPDGTGGGFGRATRSAKRYPLWRDAFTALVEAVLSDGEEMLVLLPYQEIRLQVRLWSSALDEVVGPSLAVLDFDDGAVLLAPGSLEMVGAVDFERAGWYDPLLCAACLRPSRAFVEGYGAEALEAGGAKARRLLYSCYYACVKVVSAYCRGTGDCDEMEERKNLMSSLNELGNLAGQ
ncbi:hypothetical protein HOY82DRAFT_93775 [Tuber indicum]|nr:hypothetical protein HOY82DRAFT_93775 [Tuber indicum]